MFEGGRVSHNWTMRVISHGYGGLNGGRVGGGGWHACGMKPGGVGRESGDAGALPEYEVKTLVTPDHTAIQVRSSG